MTSDCKKCNCKKCVHRIEFKRADGGNKDGSLFICMSEPYEVEEDFGIVTWLDVG